MRRLALAIALACVLSSVARAGEIPSTGAVASPTPITMTTGEIPTTGVMIAEEIHSTGAIASEDSSTVLTIILTLITIVS
jgi:hypothetical protein